MASRKERPHSSVFSGAMTGLPDCSHEVVALGYLLIPLANHGAWKITNTKEKGLENSMKINSKGEVGQT